METIFKACKNIFWINKLCAILIMPVYSIVSGVREYRYIQKEDNVQKSGMKFFFEVIHCHWRSHKESIQWYRGIKEKMNYEKRQKPWTDINLRNPKTCGWYLCAIKKLGHLGWERELHIFSWMHSAEKGYHFNTDMKVTHFMELPEVPKSI